MLVLIAGIVTLAPGTEAFEESVIVPSRLPVTAWG
jgi:hypothetical protein